MAVGVVAYLCSLGGPWFAIISSCQPARLQSRLAVQKERAVQDGIQGSFLGKDASAA